MKKVILTLTFLIYVLSTSYAYVVGSVTYKGKQYFVDVRVNGSSASIWLIKNKDACTPGDIDVLSLVASNPTVKSVKTTICRAKKIYDNGKTIAGCVATVASGACAAATVASDGATSALCTATWKYTIDKGLADCIDGVSSKIANYLGLNGWSSYAVKASISGAKWSSAISTAIDNMCADVK